MQILALDDDAFHLDILERSLRKQGHTVVRANRAGEALDLLRRGEIRLVITDWEMPEMDGLQFCRSVRTNDFNGYIYLIMLTGREGSQSRVEGLTAGADAFLTKPLDMKELEVVLRNAERIVSLETRDVALFALAKLAESRDTEVGGHIERVQSYTRLLAQHLAPRVREMNGVDAEYIRLLYQTSPLHDLGKVGIPDRVLLKPGKLDPEEFEIMKTHTTLGAQTLDAALHRFPNVQFLQMARDIAASHHEKFDGTGYPLCLAGQQIPFCGRVVALADVYDALTSRRIYKEALSHEKARETLLRERGQHFDPDIVDAFLAAEKEIISVRERLRDPSATTDGEDTRAEEESPPEPHRPCPILLVDDSPAELQIQAATLARTGEPIFTANDSLEAMQIFRSQRPGLIVSDLEMPGASGLDLCRQIRALANAGPVHFIMLTGHTDQGSMLEAYKAGVDDFLSKSFSADELLARVTAGLRTYRLHEELSRKTSHLQEVNVRLRQMNGRLDRLSITDDLTGLFNRRHAMVRLEEQWAISERYDRPFTVAMIDIDRFKHVNDSHGHDAGDIVLRRIAGILRDQTRGTDAVCRIGGEEFLIIFPSETEQEAIACSQRCRAAVEASPFRVADVQLPVTISIGIAHRNPATPQFPDLLRAADRALYAAKRTGRNRVCTADQESLLQETTMSNAIPAPTSPTGSSTLGNEAPFKWDQLIARCGGDAAFATSVAQRFAKQAPEDLSRLEEAVNNGDAKSASRLAHSLKSMTAYMSLEATSTLCKTIEETAREERMTEVPMLVAQLRRQIEAAAAWLEKHSTPPAALVA